MSESIKARSRVRSFPQKQMQGKEQAAGPRIAHGRRLRSDWPGASALPGVERAQKTQGALQPQSVCLPLCPLVHEAGPRATPAHTLTTVSTWFF